MQSFHIPLYFCLYIENVVSNGKCWITFPRFFVMHFSLYICFPILKVFLFSSHRSSLALCLSACIFFLFRFVSLPLCLFVFLSLCLCVCLNVCDLLGLSSCCCFMDSLSLYCYNYLIKNFPISDLEEIQKISFNQIKSIWNDRQKRQLTKEKKNRFIMFFT